MYRNSKNLPISGELNPFANRGAIDTRFSRLLAEGKFRVLDIFSGCGGLSLGFQSAGFDVVANIEADPTAALSHGLNFHAGQTAQCLSRDILESDPTEFCEQFGLGALGSAIDVIVGGPPCQAFARVGRPKLREIEAHPNAFKHDARARLYLEWLRYVDAFRPLAVLMENVPDILNHGGQNLAEEICEVLESRGYVCRYTLLNSAFYGVPQLRERMFLIGYRQELGVAVTFPLPSHWIELPSGYAGARAVALKLLRDSKSHRYLEGPPSNNKLPPAITTQQALGDLPPIYARELLKSGVLRRGARRFDCPMPSAADYSISDYANRMRNWPGFESKQILSDHVIRYLPRDYQIFARMNPDDQYPEAWKHAQGIFREKISALRHSGVQVVEGSEDWARLQKAIVPPYDVMKFPNKWRKLCADKPSRTLMAHLGKDGYSHIHYDSEQARTISVREAARLQSFPDGFQFSGAMNAAFRQIGNAVPPLLAKALAREINQTICLGLGNLAYGSRVKTKQPRRVAPTATAFKVTEDWF